MVVRHTADLVTAEVLMVFSFFEVSFSPEEAIDVPSPLSDS